MQSPTSQSVAPENLHDEILEVLSGEKRHHQFYDIGGFVDVGCLGDVPLQCREADAYCFGFVSAAELLDCSIEIASTVPQFPSDAARKGVGIWVKR